MDREDTLRPSQGGRDLPSADPVGLETSLNSTPKGMRLCIGIFGRRNAGKSSLLNALAGQEVSIVSPKAGTTTDPIDKAMELLPLGPVLFVDTAGLDDDEEGVGSLRIERARKVFDRCDMGILVVEAGSWSPYEDDILRELKQRKAPVIVVFNKIDLNPLSCGECLASVSDAVVDLPCVRVSTVTGEGVSEVRQALLAHAPEHFIEEQRIVGDLVPAGSTVVLVVPIDKEAPKGRLILPQVQVIRDLLDCGCIPVVVRDSELTLALSRLAEPPALVITDSQAFSAVDGLVPPDVPLTGFSVVFARYKGDLPTQAIGALAIERLTEQSRVLIAEACSHHPIEEDIGTVKIPRLLRKRVGEGLTIDNVRGRDFPSDLADYDLVIHCGGCTFNRRAMLSRIEACVAAGVPVTNYGLTLAYLTGVFDRSIRAFPGIAALVEQAR